MKHVYSTYIFHYIHIGDKSEEKGIPPLHC